MAERAELEVDARRAAPASRSANGATVEAAPESARGEIAGARARGRTGLNPRQVLAMQRLVGNRAVMDALGADTSTSNGSGEDLVEAMGVGARVGEAAGGAMAGMAAADETLGRGQRGASMAGMGQAGLAGGIPGSSAVGTAGLEGPATGGAMAGGAEAAGGAAAAGSAVVGTAGLAGQGAGGAMGGAADTAGSTVVAIAGMGEAAGGGLAGLAGQAAGGGMAGGAEAAGGAAQQAEASGPATGANPGLATGGAAGAEHADAEVAGTSGQGAGGIGRETGAATAGASPGGAGVGHGGETASHGPAGSEASAGEAPDAADESAQAGEAATTGSGGAGGGLDLDAPPPAGEPIPDATVPAAPSATEVNRLGEAPPEAAIEAGEVQASEEGEVEEEDPTAEVSGQAESVASAGQDAGDGGVIDAVVNRAKAAFRSVANTVTGAARGVASTVSGVVRNAVRGARNLARSIVDGIVSSARSIKDGVVTGIRGVFGSVMSAARGVVNRLMGAVSGAMSSVRGAVMAAIGRALRGEPLIPNFLAPVTAFLHRLFGDIPGQVTRMVTQLTQTANRYVDMLIGGVVALSQRVAAGVAGLASVLQAGVTAAANAISSLAGRAASLVAELPGLLRSAVSWLVDRLVAGVRAAVRAIEGIVNRAITSMSARIQAWVARQAERIVAVIGRVRDAVVAAAQWVANLIRAALARLAAFRDWLIRGATAVLGRVLRRVLQPLQQALMRYVIGLIGPEVHTAIATAQALFPNGMPTPPQLPQAQADAASQASSSATDEILNGLINPEGDHFSVGFTVGGDIALGGGISGGITPLQLDVVMDYRRNDIGFFVSPGASVQGNIGEAGAVASESVNFAWGTVGSFGNKDKDVLQAYGGMFSNANYGYAIGGAYEAGVGLSSGGTIYRGGSYDFGPSVDMPIAFGSTHSVPGDHTPTIREGRPDAFDTIRLGEVLFPRGSADVNASSNGATAITDAAATVNGYPAAHDGANVIRVSISGEASRVWSHPRPGESREDDNATLAQHRAENVRDRLQPLVPSQSISAQGFGDSSAARAGKAESDASPEDQRATMFADAYKAGDAGGFGPDQVGPDRQVPDTFNIRPGLPTGFVDFSQRQAWGWDTTLSVAALEGAQAKTSVFAGAGVSYSVPLGKTHFAPETMTKIRVAFGLAKIVGDIMTLSPLGLARDLLGVAPGVEALVHEHFGQAVGDWTIPTPSGIAVA